MAKDWRRLAERAARRRAELGLSQVEVAQRGPLSLDRVQAIEGAKSTRYRLGTLLALERALDWASASVDAILSGGEPTPIQTTGQRKSSDPDGSSPPYRPGELEELAGTDRYLDRVRELLPQLPPEDRPIVEEAIAAYLEGERRYREDQERQRRIVDRVIRRRRSREPESGDNGGQAAAG